MEENITAKNISRRFSGIQHTILGWNDKELDDDLFVYVYPIHYKSCEKHGFHFVMGKLGISSG